MHGADGPSDGGSPRSAGILGGTPRSGRRFQVGLRLIGEPSCGAIEGQFRTRPIQYPGRRRSCATARIWRRSGSSR